MCKCDEDMYSCVYGGGCIPSNQVCDGTVQCSDRSDEWICLQLFNASLQVRSELYRVYYTVVQHNAVNGSVTTQKVVKKCVQK